VELRETDSEGGYPVFTIVSTGGAPLGRPKNLIFASSVKPDLRFRDAVNNDIEIVGDSARGMVKKFFDALFKRHGVLATTI